MSWTNFKRVARAGFVGFWRNAFVSLSAIFVMTITLLVITSSLFVGQLLDASLAQIKSKVDINVYFVTTAEEADILALKTELQGLPEVAEVQYISRDQALEEFKKRHDNDQLMIQALDELGDNPLGATLAIRTKETSQYAGIESLLTQKKDAETTEKPFVRETNFFKNKAAIDTLTSIISAVEKFSTVALGILIAASILITFNTVRLAIFTARDEIGVMRLVGASNMFIRGPFILQGLMYGIIAGVITLAIWYPLALWLGPATESFFVFNIFNYFVSDFPYIFAVTVGSGALFGAFSSMFAVARYLKV